MTTPTIIYTHTDEAPALATYSFLPMIRAFTQPAGCLLYTSPSPRDRQKSRMPSSA